MEWFEPTRRVPDADAIPEAHFESIAQTLSAQDVEGGTLNLGSGNVWSKLPQPRAQTPERNSIEFDTDAVRGVDGSTVRPGLG